MPALPLRVDHAPDAHAAELRRVVESDQGGVHFVPVAEPMPADFEARLRAEVKQLGFVDVAPALDRLDTVLHRHVALLCATDADRAAAPVWVRRLAEVSPRCHLLLWFGRQRLTDRCPAGPRRAPIMPARSRMRLVQRDRCLRRGRPRAAESWQTAAISSARRYGDHDRALALELDLCRRLIAAGQTTRAARRIRTVLRMPDLLWAGYLAAAVLWADVTLEEGGLREARAWLTSVVTEAAIRGETTPGEIRDRMAALDFWLGRRPLSGQETDGPDNRSPDERGWRALAAWRDGDSAHLVSELDQLKQVAGRCAGSRAWIAVLENLVCAFGGTPLQASETQSDGPELTDRTRLLRSSVMAWAHLQHGNTERAERCLVDPKGRSPEAEVVRRLRDRIHRLQTGEAPASVSGLPPGLRAFLTERNTMVSVDGLGRLLKAMEEAPDDRASLVAGCVWLRRFGSDVNVGVITADGGRLIAGAGWKEQAGGHAATADLRVPVRCGASVIGHIVVSAEGRQPAVQHAAQAFAMLAGSALRSCLDALDLRNHDRDGLQEILGRSQVMADVRSSILRAAATTFPVLVEGESGTGKELVARAVHRLSARRERRFLAVNCAALTDDLVEAELFGHARGAFTGAIGARAGMFEDAHGGTLFLDEVSELSPRAQAKLLRVLQEREVRRVGETTARAVDVRIVAATNVPLGEAVARGRFRDDLRFRLAVVGLRLPALRDRLEDLPVLTHVFWRRALTETGKRAYLGHDALARLARHAWQGNVRELQNAVSGLAVIAPTSGRVTARHVTQVLEQVSGSAEETVTQALPLEDARRVFERRFVAATLARHAGRRSAAANDLGLSRQGLAKALRRLGLEGDRAGVA
jgi:two-component system response regulator HydG